MESGSILQYINHQEFVELDECIQTGIDCLDSEGYHSASRRLGLAWAKHCIELNSIIVAQSDVSEHEGIDQILYMAQSIVKDDQKEDRGF